MDILLCWSMERSRLIAAELREWLPRVLPGASPWMSEKDVNKGRDWFAELHSILAEAKAVVVCITPENIRSPWIYYECGQVAGRGESHLICPYLLEGRSSILAEGPLGHFQHTAAVKEDTFCLVKALNAALGTRGAEESALGRRFESEWAVLSGMISRIRQLEVAPRTSGPSIATDIDTTAGGELSDSAREMLLAIGRDQHASIIVVTTAGGHHFQANGKDLNSGGNARSTARWRAALQRLLGLQLLEMRGNKGEIYTLTEKGFRVFDLLAEIKSTATS
jgi:TIR domain